MPFNGKFTRADIGKYFIVKSWVRSARGHIMLCRITDVGHNWVGFREETSHIYPDAVHYVGYRFHRMNRTTDVDGWEYRPYVPYENDIRNFEGSGK